MNCFLTWWLSVDDLCLAMESFRGVITFQSVVLTRVHLRMGYVYALFLMKPPCMLTCEMCWSTKTKETISLIRLWNPLLLLNSLCNEETFFYIGFSKPWPSLHLRMRWWDSCPQHETFNQALPTQQGAERAWKLLPSVFGSPIQNDGSRARSHGVSR